MWIARQARDPGKLCTWPEGTFEAAMVQTDKAIEAFSAQYEGTRFLAGEGMSLADIFATHLPTWASACRVALPTPVQGYVETMVAREAYPSQV